MSAWLDCVSIVVQHTFQIIHSRYSFVGYAQGLRTLGTRFTYGSLAAISAQRQCYGLSRDRKRKSHKKADTGWMRLARINPPLSLTIHINIVEMSGVLLTHIESGSIRHHIEHRAEGKSCFPFTTIFSRMTFVILMQLLFECIANRWIRFFRPTICHSWGITSTWKRTRGENAFAMRNYGNYKFVSLVFFCFDFPSHIII